MTLTLAYAFLDGVLMSLFCILIVFAILYLITLAVRPLILTERMKSPVVPAPQAAVPFGPGDVTDDDMMAAILVAAIDYRQETKKDIRILSAKEIKS